MKKKKRVFAVWILLLGAAFLCQPVFAQIFRNQFIEFRIPDKWDCRVEGTEWVCQSENPRIRKETLLVFAAKVASDKDNLQEYFDYLNSPRTIQGTHGRPIQSEVTYARRKTIHGHTWIDAIHKNSEMPGFITRYLATTFQEIAILFTYSVLEPQYDTYANMLTQMVETIKPRREAAPLTVAEAPRPVTRISVADLLRRARDKDLDEKVDEPIVHLAPLPEEEPGGGMMWLLLIIIAAGAGAYIYIRKKKTAASKKSESDEDVDADEDWEDEEDDVGADMDTAEDDEDDEHRS